MKKKYFKNQKIITLNLHFSTVFFSIVASFLFSLSVSSQAVGINDDGVPPAESSGLDMDFSDRGFLVPRVTTAERDAIPNPAMSLLVFNTKTLCFEAWNSNRSDWIAFGCIASPFSCGDIFVDSRDSKSYTTVEIGGQCWMKENLNYIPALGNSWCMRMSQIVVLFTVVYMTGKQLWMVV